ncbi:MAG: hypothetical protein OEY14_02395, partial [Myxococcales bacterium]|nr:hypothetical protein [Myxococcales bacterium]
MTFSLASAVGSVYLLTLTSVLGDPMTGSTATPSSRSAEERLHPDGPVAIGIDVGSTTVKAVVVDPESQTILWRDYRRHHTRQPECVLDLLIRIGHAFSEVPREAI